MTRSSSSDAGFVPLELPVRRDCRRMLGRVLALLVPSLAAGLNPEPVMGQERSVLSLLDTEGRRLSLDVAQAGSLGYEDLVTGSGQRVQAWILEGVTGPVQVDLTSEDFDAFLYVLSPGAGPVLENDDGGGGLDARVCLSAPGSYTVVASSLGGGIGAFTLRASPDPDRTCAPLDDVAFDDEADVLAALEAVVPTGPVEVPGTETFRFDGNEPRVEGRPVRAWTFRGDAGDRFALTHRAGGVDTYLYLAGPGFPRPLRDDDSAGDLDARPCVELPAAGEFTVYDAPFSAEEVGALHRLETARGADAERACEGDFTSSPAVLVERLSALDVQGRVIRVGEEASGVLTTAQLHPWSGEPIQAWRLEAAPGTLLYVDVVSDAFDPTVRAVWPGLDEELMNDDFGAGCNSRLELVVPAQGPVTLLPGAWSSTGEGEFLLRVSTAPGPLEEGGCGEGGFDGEFGAGAAAWEMVGRFASPGERLQAGTEREVVLDEAGTLVVEGIRARGFELVIEEPGDWVVEATSDELDPVLYVMGPSLSEPLFDDDSGGALNARVEVEDAEPGRWIVVVGALGEAVGPVRIRALRRGGG